MDASFLEAVKAAYWFFSIFGRHPLFSRLLFGGVGGGLCAPIVGHDSQDNKEKKDGLGDICQGVYKMLYDIS